VFSGGVTTEKVVRNREDVFGGLGGMVKRGRGGRKPYEGRSFCSRGGGMIQLYQHHNQAFPVIVRNI
jgi:hypothetical protein